MRSILIDYLQLINEISALMSSYYGKDIIEMREVNTNNLLVRIFIFPYKLLLQEIISRWQLDANEYNDQ